MQPERYQRRIERPGFDSAFALETAQTTQLRALVREKRQVARKGIVAIWVEHAH